MDANANNVSADYDPCVYLRRKLSDGHDRRFKSCRHQLRGDAEYPEVRGHPPEVRGHFNKPRQV